MITKDKIRKLLLKEPLDIVDKDTAYFRISEDFGLDICVSFETYADSEEGVYDDSTYTMKITDLTLDKEIGKGEKLEWMRLVYTQSELEKLSFNDQTEESIKVNYLND